MIGHIGDDFYRSYDQTNSVKALNETSWSCRIYQTCKNCSYEFAADCEHCHTTQHGAVLIIFPLNLQTITITQMLSSGGEGGTTRFQASHSTLYYSIIALNAI